VDFVGLRWKAIPPSLCTPLHTSAVRYLAERRNRSSHAQASRNERGKSQRPHVVLGTKPGDESKWINCDLYKVLIKPEDVPAAAMQASAESTEDEEPFKYLGFGVGEKEKAMLFEQLPILTAQNSLDTSNDPDPDELRETGLWLEQDAQHRASMLTTLMHLRNQNASGFNYHNRRQIILAFSEPENPYDTGRPEVQGILRSNDDTFKLT
jgi:small subunit ribosomal protein S15